MAEYTPRGSAVKRYHEGRQSQPANGGNQAFEPGYVDVPGKGRRYRNASGEYFQNHFGSILNSFRKAKDGAGDAYNNYYNSVADAAGTERRDGSVAPIVGATPKTKNQAAPAKPAEETPYRSRRQGLDAVYPDRAPTPTPKPEPQKPGARVNANGLVSYGKDLSSLNAFTKEFTGGYEIADISTAFQSEDLPMKGSKGTNTDYSLDDAEAMGVSKEDALTISEGGFVETLITPSTPGTTGNNPKNSQDGTSDKPDVAEEVRTIRMRRKGPRDDGGPRGFAIDRANEMAQNSVSETKGDGMNARRREIRSTFLNHEGNSIQAITAARAVAGVGNDSNGSDVYNVGGELVYAKPGEERKAINSLMSGNNPMAHLDMPETPDVQPDTPADTQLSMTDPIKDMTEEQQKKAAQLFAKGFVSDISGKLKDK